MALIQHYFFGCLPLHEIAVVQAVFLHCIEQHPGEGGETMLADGFEAARQLRAARPEVATITSLTRRWDDESVTNTWN